MKVIMDADKIIERRFIDGEAMDNSRERTRRELLLLSVPVRRALSRAYFKDLRAAEMMAWEETGGDYLISHNKRHAETEHAMAD
jgi:hypothetical protein